MTSPAVDPATPAFKGPGFPEFVALIAMMMALNALAIDMMLPALPAIGEALGVATENSRQWVITAYLLGFGGAQLIYGPLADRYGRKPVLMAGLSLYVLFSTLAAFAPTFELLILARIATGLGAAALRVLAVSIVRDRYSGRTMARVMSLSFLVFLGVPILAPAFGQLILTVAPWPWIFGVLAVAGSAFLIWAALRLPETLHAENRMPIQVGRIASAFREAVTHRQAIGYTLAMTCITGALFGFINSSQQIFFDVFNEPRLFTAVFAAIAGGIAVASLLNAKLVERLGSRLISHTALLGFITMSAIHAAVALTGHETIWTFSILQALTMFCFGFIAGNFGAMAMEPMGHIAGTASSAQGFISTTAGASLGFLIGQQFNGSAAPMTVGFTALGLTALVCVLIAERGRLFTGRNAAPVPAAS
ncbi:MAG: multidrug effflux MFS transporter [Alphaproteobacteria bacterium]|jgi:MFS transporter, DHA1 family, multidrug resistance protein|nr:multidrug effflux MFS transporter [Alphaproteobacteria bacterium]MBU2043283.1 multidrug effflux MFS transporter [Alphaproteobacteria bacterium]MBU2125028.1 multidrug effflux MFS transporter [Alphaproteobacteria bacterium]MBU2208772.1 multidrug effflux MFS transporter [Alphaproteobacteria bacterium]MBU2292262.1 multidrug effflux MFS transporter [Alphaproteobacteria bacterium]